MKNMHIRAFEIDGVRFHITGRDDGRLQITGIRPYDDTEYHWAVQAKPASKSVWLICRNGKKHLTVGRNGGSEIEPEEVARKLLAMDAEAGLRPTPAIW